MFDPPSPAPAPRALHSPSSLTRLVRDLLEDTLPTVWIEGEISNFSRPASGHLYFTLKDAGAQVRCAMFKPRSTALRFRPADGLRVTARARVSLYEARGEFQLIVDSLEEAGEGALRRAFEELKARLAAEGLFDASVKRALPRFARRIGIVTSPTGAAVRDILSVLRRRYPLVEVDVLPVPVQGREAPPAIVAMLGAASRARRHDVLVLARGGGSLEDLWAFNDEAVARAIRASAIPVVSAIGHEIDFTIADFAADLRAPTPSAAAELLVPDATALMRELLRQRMRLAQRMRRVHEAHAMRLDHLLARLSAQRPQARIARATDRLRDARRRLGLLALGSLERASRHLAQAQTRLVARNPRARLAQDAMRLQAGHVRLRTLAQAAIDRPRARVVELGRALHAVSPLATLDRGYAILRTADGGVVRSARSVLPGTPLRARLADGELALVITSD